MTAQHADARARSSHGATDAPRVLDGIACLEDEAAIQGARNRQALAWWHGARGGNVAPAAQAFDVLDLAPIASHLALLDVIGEGADFHHRLIGTAIVEHLGVDGTGTPLSAYDRESEFSRRTWHILGLVVSQRRPVLNQPGYARVAGREHRRHESLTLPLVGADGRVERVLSVLDFLN